MPNLPWVAAVAAITIASTPALAAPGDVRSSDPASVVQALRDLGYTPTLKKDSDGDPMIDAKMGGYNVTVYFYGCTANRNCDSIQFRAGFTAKGTFSYARAVEWTTKHRYGGIMLDKEGDPFLNWDVVVGPGLSRETFKQVCSAYAGVVSDFADFVFSEKK